MSDNLIWRPGQFLVPQYTGTNLRLADRIADVDVYRGPIAGCRSGTVLRGTFGVGARLGWVCTSSEVTWESKGIGILRINWEVGGPFAPTYLLPLDDFREESVELYPKVESHPAMFGPTYPGNPGDKILSYTIGLCYQATNGATQDARSQALAFLNSMAGWSNSGFDDGTTWAAQANFGAILYNWLMQRNETYYLAGRKYSYIRHFFTFPETSDGGVTETPQFGPRAGNTSMSWLRLADAVEPAGVNGSVYKMTSTWLGGPIGHWDPILYPASP